MSSIFKLSIKGIRSFDPIDTETIEFNKPLTLIVGSNGSGKTSIIECLKFATTGDLPPNSKGGAFIHDPNIGGEKSVVAQIKLAFNNINNKNMILTKTMQLINKKASNTFKTLENQLVVLNNGERVTISTKAADIEQLVPQFLGVTSAILNYVIFCHQEDSLWPISEPGVLKKRFDEIFDSVKFIKVLDSFKELRKQFNEDIKLLTNNVDHLKQDRKRANSKRVEKEQLQTTIEQYELEVEEADDKLKQVTARMDELFKSNQDYEAVINKIESLELQNGSLKRQITKLKDEIKFLPEEDNELQRKLSDFNLDQKKLQQEIADLKTQTDKILSQISQKRLLYNNNIRLEGELKSLSSVNEKNVVERDSLMALNDLKLTIPDQVDATFVKEYISVLKTRISSSEKSYNGVHSEFLDAQKQFEMSNSMIRDDKMKKLQQQKYLSENLDKYKKQVSEIERKIRSKATNELELEEERQEQVILKQKFDDLKKSRLIAAIASDINSVNREILGLESDIETLNRLIATSNKKNESLNRVKFLEEQKTKTDANMNKLIKENEDSFCCLTEETVLSSKDCLAIANRLRDDASNKADDCLLDLDMAQHEEYECLTELKQIQQELATIRLEVSTRSDKVKAILPEDVALTDYEEYTKSMESDYDILLQNINVTEVSLRFNEAAVNSAKKDKCCMLCRREFEDDELPRFYKLLEEHTQKLRNGDAMREKDQLKSELDELKSVLYDVTRLRLLEHEKIAELNAKEREMKKKLEDLKVKVTEKKLAAETLKSKVELAKQIVNVAKDISRLNRESENLQEQLSSLSDEFFGVQVKSVAELQVEQEEVNSQLKNQRKKLNELLERKEESTKEINRLELRIKEKSLKISNLEKELIDLRNLQYQQDEMARQISQTEAELQDSKKYVSDLDDQYTQLKAKYDQILPGLESKCDELLKFLESYREVLGKIESLDTEINKYLDQDLPRLRKCSKEAIDLEAEIRQLELQVDEGNDNIAKLERDLMDSDKVLRNIKDNIDLRSLEKELQENLSKIEELEVQNARISRANYQQETHRLNQEFSELKSEHLMKKGEILQLSKQVQGIERELQKEYKNIEKKYNEEYLRLQTKFFVNNDLSVYSKALDNAIMKFHSLKMKEINEIIDQLWRTTYSGSDVDTILIKSETNTAGVKSGNRSYNYRVVMIKQGVELDMRGRCSAGQKVLASIIIRLALLECFGINFGMITLDEPTTNLDEDNIESLLKSLNQIIEMRQKQKNFQLIVITHDEKFLKFMGAAKFTDLYYRVSRDETQTSVIEAVPIAIINE